MKRQAIFIFLLLAVNLGNILAQAPLYKHFTVNDGLPSSIVYDVIQDSKGFIWVGTENGVARYDGKSFETFTSEDGLPDNVILRLFADSKGRVWLFGLNGKPCYFYEGKIYNASNSRFLAKFPNCGTVLNYLEENGVLYFNLEMGCCFEIKDEKISVVRNFKAENHFDFSIAHFINNIWGIGIHENHGFLFVKNKTYYFHSNSGIYKLSNSTEKLIISNKSLHLEGHTHKQFLIKDDLWLSFTDQGVTKVSNLSGAWRVQKFLPGKKVTGVCQDHEGNTWFGTEGAGLWLMLENLERIKSYQFSDGLPEVGISVLHKDNNNRIWMGAGNGELFGFKNGRIIKYDIIPKTKMLNQFYDIWSDKNDCFYFVTNKYLVKWKENKANVMEFDSLLARYSINYKSISGNASNKIVAATRISIGLYNPNDSAMAKNKMRRIYLKNSQRIFTAFIASNNKIWIANYKGLGFLQGDSFVSVAHLNKILAASIAKISELPDGKLLMATRTSGLVLFNGEKVLQVINAKDGIPSDICHKINIQGNNIWVATHAGVAKLIYKNSRVYWLRNFTANDGLMSNEINDVVSTGDSIYVAFAEGVSVLPDLPVSISRPPYIYIKEVIYNNQDIGNVNDTIVSYTKKYTRFIFSAITFQNPEKVVYQYRLLGADNKWQNNTNGSVDYATLKPGKYTFQMRAKKLNSNWSGIKSYSFEINAPFWLKGWFSLSVYALGFTIAGLGISGFTRQQRKRKEKKMLLQTKMVQLEQQALSALMNPHFIFNSLNSIQHYLHNNDTLSANKYLSLFAKLTRRNMEAVMKSEVTLDDELERLELYLQFEKLRFGERLAHQIIIPENFDTEEITIPPMVIQPFVENAIWHGIMPLPKGGKILIEVASISAGFFSIAIKDNGIGVDVSREINIGKKHNSKGMNITRERLEIWSREKGSSFSMTIEQIKSGSGKSAGTIALLKLPVVNY